MANPVPATVNSDRVLNIPLRSDLGNGVYGPVTNSTWNLGTDFASFLMMPLVLSAESQLVSHPWLAKTWAVAPDCRSATYTIYKEAKWSDGKPVTTKDVNFTLSLLYDPKAKYQYGDAREFLTNVKGGADFHDGKAKSVSGLTAVDDFNGKIEFDAPGLCDPFGVRRLNFVGIVPEHVLNKYTAEQIWTGEFPEAWMPTVYSGPYKVTKWDKEQKFMQIQRNEDWWGNAIFGKPNIKNIAGQPTNLAALLANKTDLIGLGFADAQKMKDNKDFTFQSRPWVSFILGFNMRDNRKLSKEMREAILYATDKQSHIQVVNLGTGVPLRNPFGWGPEQTPWCTIPECDKALFTAYAYDVAKAKELIQAAKWDSNKELVILAGSTDPSGTLLQQQLLAVGIKSTLNTNDDLRDKLMTSGDFDIWINTGWPTNNPVAFCQYWLGEPKDNYYVQRLGWVNQDFRTACELGSGTSDPKARQLAFLKAVKIYSDEVGPIQAIGQSTRFYAMNPDLGGFDSAFSLENWTGLRGPYGIIGWYWKK
ncbi:MAG: ABC transporter substrate-binding protein [Chloroflexi bacterium]|nr:ABC transporter substrate-binding protein [Chloroflexota bacterium]